MKPVYIDISKDSVNSTVILVGDRNRINIFEPLLDKAEKIFENREFKILNGSYRDMRLSIVSTGMGAPTTAIVIEELFSLGVRKFVRVGTMLSINDRSLGKLIVPIGTVRDDSITEKYVALGYPAIADFHFVETAFSTAKELGFEIGDGIIYSSEAFFVDYVPGFRTKDEILNKKHDELTRIGVVGMDMETSTLFTLARIMNSRAGAICAITAQSNGERLAEDERVKIENKMIKLALETCKNWR